MAAPADELASRYAGAVSAEGACFVRAVHVPDALAALGLVSANDQLIVCADDFETAFLERFRRESLLFVEEPSAEAFAAAQTDAEARTGRAPEQGSAGAVYWFVNSIGCRGLRVPDLRALASAAHEAGALLVVDNTVPSYYGCSPLALGADLVLEALDRVAAGRLGEKAVAVAWARAFDAARIMGARCTQVDAFALQDLSVLAEGLDTLPERMQRHFDNARALAEYLSCCEGLVSVSYPGLGSHQDHETATRILQHGFGPAIDFELSHTVSAGSFINRCRLNGRACAAGGVPTRLSARDGRDAFAVRLFAGLDAPLDIADDLDQAMRWFRNPPEP